MINKGKYVNQLQALRYNATHTGLILLTIGNRYNRVSCTTLLVCCRVCTQVYAHVHVCLHKRMHMYRCACAHVLTRSPCVALRMNLRFMEYIALAN